MNTDKHEFNRSKRSERRREGKIMMGKIIGRIANYHCRHRSVTSSFSELNPLIAPALVMNPQIASR